jgi:hypothetical protein
VQLHDLFDCLRQLAGPSQGGHLPALWQVLSGEEKGSRDARLSPESRPAAVEILRQTKPGLPDYFVPPVR